ncbi:MAG: DNA recombination protein RmuC [Acidaminococcales bacterium]|jgi:DNA recombination protein RmuC|nr:DNA recombination protein RmuC [Acidaminococcales bacterium]
MDNAFWPLLLDIAALALLAVILLKLKNQAALEKELAALKALLDNLSVSGNQEKQLLRQEQNEQGRHLREEIARNFQRLNDFLLAQLALAAGQQQEKIEKLTENMAGLLASNAQQLEKINENVGRGLREMQEKNEQKLEAMRAVVDEKLSRTLSARLDDAFKNVGEQLGQLYKSLGEMKNLSAGVQSLNRVLTNVKMRGTWGEVQLGALLEQIMSPGQYEQSVAVRRGGRERVDFAIKLPGRGAEHVWLPIDAKFTQEDYLRLSDAAEAADAAGVAEALRALETRVKQDARSIRDKYLNPPETTDFAVMFLPTEGLYAEVLRINGLAEYCQRECRTIIAGPTTLAALLNSLRVGFVTLAIEKKSGEVWKLLGAVKKQYAMFDQLLEKSIKKLEDAQQDMSDAQARSKQIYTKLNKVEEAGTEERGFLPDGEGMGGGRL